jgi:hypothetical protein
MDRAAWQQPTVQQELKNWADGLNSVGFNVTPQELEDRLWKLADGYMKLRDSATSPFDWYYEYCGTYQGWRMFSGPQMYPAKLYIDVRERDVWVPLYVEGDPQHRWLGGELDSYRFRALRFRLANMSGFESEYKLFAHWVAMRAAKDFPDADRVRVSLYRYTLLTAAEVRAGKAVEGEFEQVTEHPLRGTP